MPCPLTSREEVDAALSMQRTTEVGAPHGVPEVDLGGFTTIVECHGFSEKLMRRLKFVPLYRGTHGLVVAMEDPCDADLIQKLRFISDLRIVPVYAPRAHIRRALDVPQADPYPECRLEEESGFDLSPDRLALAPESGELAWRLTRDSDNARVALVPEEAPGETDNTLVQLLNRIVVEAFEEGASDIHFEPRGEGEVQVRLRRDGVLRDFLVVPAKYRAAIISRIKIMASLDISERRKAQDGKIDFKRFGPADVELRVATIPLANGLEGVVLRILSSANALPTGALGLAADTLKSLREAVERPHGLILVCGPTGSGKTTTLHSLLGHLNSGDRKIWTAEDPIEITQSGLSQVQVNPRVGWTFASALRAFLRADPDVIMVGEMRDRETATIAVEASLTGHLVMSTLHTNGAPDAAIRLIDMGLDPFSSSDALIGVLAQRLARRVCPHCSVVRPATAEEMAIYELEYGDEAPDQEPAANAWRNRFSARVAIPVGCDACSGTGYLGRVGLYEWMLVTPELRGCLQRRANAQELRSVAIAEGMRTLRQDGIQKALQGLTTLEQIRSVCGIVAVRAHPPHGRMADIASSQARLAA